MTIPLFVRMRTQSVKGVRRLFRGETDTADEGVGRLFGGETEAIGEGVRRLFRGKTNRRGEAARKKPFPSAGAGRPSNRICKFRTKIERLRHKSKVSLVNSIVPCYNVAQERAVL